MQTDYPEHHQDGFGYHHPMRVFHRAESMLLKKKGRLFSWPFLRRLLKDQYLATTGISKDLIPLCQLNRVAQWHKVAQVAQDRALSRRDPSSLEIAAATRDILGAIMCRSPLCHAVITARRTEFGCRFSSSGVMSSRVLPSVQWGPAQEPLGEDDDDSAPDPVPLVPPCATVPPGLAGTAVPRIGMIEEAKDTYEWLASSVAAAIDLIARR